MAKDDVSVKSAAVPDLLGKLPTFTDCDGMSHVPRLWENRAAKLELLGLMGLLVSHLGVHLDLHMGPNGPVVPDVTAR